MGYIRQHLCVRILPIREIAVAERAVGRHRNAILFAPGKNGMLDGTFPPGSVSGAPKSSALRIIAREETAPRGPYCGAIGWIDADARRAELAVGIRTFWWDDADGGTLRFGTGAGITWGSEPEGEWRETELKAHRLMSLASDTMSA